MVHGKRIDAVGDAELESGLVGLGLLTTRVSGTGQLLSEVPEETSGNSSGSCVHRGNAVAGSDHEIGGAVGIAHVFVDEMPQLMADHSKQLVIVHDVHQG